ncbi:MAG: hypothetical protein KC635_21515 [Myxococcales bacterium]|nr:hypothetical protein [Myxococcales bacterium]MCB9732414.1 hypothetical protein [Deltaproteobacteria bacterium]
MTALETTRRLPGLLAVALAAIALSIVAPPARAADAASVCVLYFDNNTGDPEWEPLKKGLADMVVSDLAGVDGLVVVERSRLEDVLGELDLQHTKAFDQATAQKVGKLVGARYAVTGAIAAVAPKIRLDVRLIDVQTAQVVVAEKIVGERDRFFELQEQLLGVFAKALGRSLPGKASVARVEKVETALEFGRGLELADRGEVEKAEKALKEVVKEAPRFKLGQTRYLDVMRALQAAKEKRAGAMESGAEALLAKCDAELAGKDPAKLSGRKLERYLAYRVLRGNLFAGALAKLAGADNPIIAKKIPAGREGDAKKLMAAHVENQAKLAAELARIGRKKIPSFPSVDDDDRKAGQELGLGPNPERFPFMSAQTVARSLARFIVLGAPDMMASVNAKVVPALATLDPSYGDRATALLDGALADIAQNERAELKERETTRTLDLYGDVLLALGRPVEAIARWQQILDDYPRSSQFAATEKKIRAALEHAE